MTCWWGVCITESGGNWEVKVPDCERESWGSNCTLSVERQHLPLNIFTIMWILLYSESVWRNGLNVHQICTPSFCTSYDIFCNQLTESIFLLNFVLLLLHIMLYPHLVYTLHPIQPLQFGMMFSLAACSLSLPVCNCYTVPQAVWLHYCSNTAACMLFLPENSFGSTHSIWTRNLGWRATVYSSV